MLVSLIITHILELTVGREFLTNTQLETVCEDCRSKFQICRRPVGRRAAVKPLRPAKAFHSQTMTNIFNHRGARSSDADQFACNADPWHRSR